MRFFLVLITTLTLNSLAQDADSLSVSKHMNSIVHDFPNRNYLNLSSLNGCAQYIHDEFGKYSEDVSFQNYQAQGNEYKNVIARFGKKEDPKLVVGAHYDVCGGQDGADDNASGVVGLLEIARMLKGVELNLQIELVAYTLEEPPFFRSEKMGSYVHAKSLVDNNEEVFGMICLEMIGYFSNEKKSQNYPIGLLKMFYGGKGDYITLVKKFGPGKMAKKFKRAFNKKELIKTKNFTAPAKLTGIDFSDHLNYWLFDYSAVMVTNTGFYRNPNYHQKSDTIETLDLNKMALVINQVFKGILRISQ